jgi:hypothetical protein
MKDDHAWVESFFQMITKENLELAKLFQVLGSPTRTSLAGDVENIFIDPQDKRFQTIFISIKPSTKAICSIGFIGKTFQISFLECQKYTSRYIRNLIIYDEQVEFNFILNTPINKLRAIICTTDETKLISSDAEVENIIFNNIRFVF